MGLLLACPIGFPCVSCFQSTTFPKMSCSPEGSITSNEIYLSYASGPIYQPLVYVPLVQMLVLSIQYHHHVEILVNLWDDLILPHYLPTWT